MLRNHTNTNPNSGMTAGNTLGYGTAPAYINTISGTIPASTQLSGNTLGYGTTIPPQQQPPQQYTLHGLQPSGTVTYTTGPTATNLSSLGYTSTSAQGTTSNIHQTSSTIVTFGTPSTTTTTTVIRKWLMFGESIVY